ncbi:MAG: PilZ domain-containing protein [Acetatifactor sp.]|nr:PilZ domain-containing protein [Acetatifactor sp.]
MQNERRRNKRTCMESSLIIKKLDEKGSNKEVSVEITDVSKTGIGFTCDEPLQIGEVYESFLTIWTKEVLHAFLQIVRIEITGDSFSYGALFIGMTEIEAARIEVYQTVHDKK